MNILTKLFTKEGRMQATAERTEGELQARLAEIATAIAGGTVTADELEEKESLERQIQAAAYARQARADEAYRARVTDQANELRGRVNESLDELGDLVPRLLLACAHFNTIVAEVQEKGLGFNPGAVLLEDVFCIPPDFGARLIAAIKEISPRTQWDYSHTGPLGKGVKAERPKLKPGPTIHFAPDYRRPPGYTGVRWPPEEPEAGPIVAFLPPAT
jgi:hypothetical protein